MKAKTTLVELIEFFNNPTHFPNGDGHARLKEFVEKLYLYLDQKQRGSDEFEEALNEAIELHSKQWRD